MAYVFCFMQFRCGWLVIVLSWQWSRLCHIKLCSKHCHILLVCVGQARKKNNWWLSWTAILLLLYIHAIETTHINHCDVTILNAGKLNLFSSTRELNDQIVVFNLKRWQGLLIMLWLWFYYIIIYFWCFYY